MIGLFEIGSILKALDGATVERLMSIARLYGDNKDVISTITKQEYTTEQYNQARERLIKCGVAMLTDYKDANDPAVLQGLAFLLVEILPAILSHDQEMVGEFLNYVDVQLKEHAASLT